MLMDSDMVCPVCGGETEYVGSGKMQKQDYGKDMRIAIPRRRTSCIGVIIGIAVASAILYYSYRRLMGAPTNVPADPAAATKFFDKLQQNRQKK